MRLHHFVPALLTVVWALAPVPALPQPEPTAPPVPLVLAGGTVVDVTVWGDSARDIPDAIVVIREGRITDVGLPVK